MNTALRTRLEKRIVTLESQAVQEDTWARESSSGGSHDILRADRHTDEADVVYGVSLIDFGAFFNALHYWLIHPVGTTMPMGWQ